MKNPATIIVIELHATHPCRLALGHAGDRRRNRWRNATSAATNAAKRHRTAKSHSIIHNHHPQSKTSIKNHNETTKHVIFAGLQRNKSYQCTITVAGDSGPSLIIKKDSIMIVYGSSISPFVRKVLFFIGEKGLDTKHFPVAPNDASPEFNASSPFGKIPGFTDGDFQLADSSAICHYVELKHPGRGLFPTDAQGYGRMVWFDKFTDTIMFPAMGKIFFNLFVKPKMLGQEPDMAVVQQGVDELPPIYAYLESQIHGEFLVGDDISLADISVSSPFINMKMVGHDLDAAKYPKLAAYLAKMHARPALIAINDKKAAA
jgi:glutathione S-transferase